MNDLAPVQNEVWQRIREATKKGDAAILPLLGQIAAEMDAKCIEWKSQLAADNGTPPNNQSRPSIQAHESRQGVDGEFTGRRIIAIERGGVRTPIASYRDLLLTVADSLRAKFPERFDVVAPNIRGRFPYFSLAENQLRKPVKLKAGPLYVETNLNSNLIVEICGRLLDALGIDRSELVIITELDRSRALKRSLSAGRDATQRSRIVSHRSAGEI